MHTPQHPKPQQKHTSNTPTSRPHPPSHTIIRQKRTTYKHAHINTTQTHAPGPSAKQIHSTPSTQAKTCAAHTPHTQPHTERTHRRISPARARTHAYMHTYIHTQPAPSFPPGGREGGEEGGRERKEGGWAERRCGHRSSFPFDPFTLLFPIPKQRE